MKGKFRIEDDLVYKMPVHFSGEPFYPVRTVYGDMTTISISFETDEDALLKIIPEDFDLTSPTVNIQFAECRALGRALEQHVLLRFSLLGLEQRPVGLVRRLRGARRL